MKKFCLLILTLCLAAGVPAFADGTINMANPSPSGGTGWTFSGNVVTITADGNYTVTGTTSANRIVINKNVTATVTLQNANIHSAVASPFMLSSDTIAGRKGSQVTLILSGNNELVTTNIGSAGLQVEDSAKITIEGAGSLLAQGAGENSANNESGGAGIGGGNGKSAGTVIIKSGTITATGGNTGAGIGGGTYGSGGNITITGGTITATVVEYGAGIGGGGGGNGGNITITGGTITATSGVTGAGIGGGDAGNGGNITVSGGDITATGGYQGAGIGGGCLGNGGNITVTDGTVTATGGHEAAGIGSGPYSNDGGNITISGGAVHATGGLTGAGIGGGWHVDGGNITISGGTVVALTPGGNGDPAGIGGGGWGDAGTINITGGTVYASGGTGPGIGGGTSATEGVINITGGAVIADEIGMGNSRTETYISGANTIALSPSINTTSFGGAQVLTGTNIGVSCSVAGGNIDYKVTLKADLTIPSGCTLVVPAGIVFDVNHRRLTVNGELVRQGQVVNEDYIPPVRDINLSALDTDADNRDGWTYLGNIVTITGSGDRTITGSTDVACVVIEKDVTAVITLDNVRIHSAGASPISLSSDAAGGSQVTVKLVGSNELVTTGARAAGLRVENNAGLTIEGTGSLVAMTPGGAGDPAGIGGGAFADAGTINITGGTVYASGGTGPGIGAGAGATGGVINITGGTVIADDIGMGNTRTETNISGANTIALSPSINTATFGGAQVLTGTNIGISCSVADGNIDYKVTLHGDLTIPSGSTLIVPAGIVFDVNHKGLLNNGIIREYGSIINTKYLVGTPPVGAIRIESFPAQTYTYTGDSIKPPVTVTDGNLTLTPGVHYSVAYTNNINAGRATVTVTDLGDNSVVTQTFTIAPKTLAADWITDIPGETYTGDSIKPVVVKDGSKTLTLNTDYTVAYTNNIKAGAATATVTGTGNYTGSATTTFFITRRPVAADWIESIPDQAYTGEPIKPALIVKDGNDTLTLNTDYTVACSNNINVGTATVTVTGIGNYTGNASKTFIIVKAPVGDWIAGIPDQTYTGDSIKPAVVVKDGNDTLILNRDYTVAYNNNVNAGTAAVVTVTGMGSYSYAGSASKTFIIAPKPVATGWLGNIPAPTYTGEPAKPAFTVKDGSKVLTEGRDYSVTCENNVNAGTAVATVTGTGNYTGAVSKTFTILPKEITAEWVEDIPLQTHTGEAIKPAVVVTDGSKVLTGGRDYTVWYSNNTGAGTATATITAEGNYSGTVNKTFVIAPSQVAAGWWIEVLADQTYTGEALMPAIMVSDASRTLVPGTDYTAAEYSNNVNAGAATVMVTGRGNYTGTAIQTFTILPKAIAAEWLENIPAQPYTGEPAKPAVTVKDGGKVLTADLHYAFAYRDNVDAGTATAIVRGRGNYAGQVEKTFAIAPKLIADDWLEPIPAQTYTGKAIKPALTVVDGSRTLAPNTDYAAIAYSNNTDAGTATVMIEGVGNYGGTAGKTFTIRPKTITADMVWATGDRLYTGEPVEPLMIIDQLGSGVLKEGTDYEIAYTNNTEEGTASYTVTGRGNYDGTVMGTFGIVRSGKPILDSWVQSIPAQPYTGRAVEPYVAVAGLALGTDYAVYYYNNVEPGTATAVITGTGDYAGSVSKAFVISPKRGIAGSWIAYIAPQTYTGDSLKPAVTVGNGAVILTSGTDYTVEYSNNVNAGTATATVTGAGVYSGTASREFIIERQPLPGSAIEPIGDEVYTGGALEPSVAVTGLALGTDYAVEYSGNINAGRATAAVTGKGNYAGTVYAYFTIRPKPVAGGWIGNIPAQTYTGDSIKPAVVVADGTGTLEPGTDYTINYSDNLNAGTATVTLTGRGNYGGTATGTFVIDRLALRSSWVLLIPDQYYTGSAVRPPVTVVGLAQDVDYTVSWSDNVNAGTATVTISGKGNYTGEVTRSFRIISTGTEEAAHIVLRIISADGGIFINGLTPGKTFSIYTITGKKYYSGTAQSDVFRLDNIPAGLYILYHDGQYSKFSY